MIEIFKDVIGYEGLYMVSNRGNVKSLDRLDSMGRIVTGRLLKLSLAKNGYYRVSLHRGGKQKYFSAHQLIAMSFLGHTPCRYRVVVDHIDNNPLNNNLDNIQIISARENSSKDKKEGTSKYVGVSWSKSRKRWKAKIFHNGNNKHIGSFKNEEEASDAYQKELKSINNQSLWN